MIHGKAFDVLLRLAAGWDLRERERDQWGPLGMTLLVVAAVLLAAVGLGGGMTQWTRALVCAAVISGLYLHGLWLDGARALDEEDEG